MTSLATLLERTLIVSAPMAGAAGGRLAHAVTEGGGLGMVGTRGTSSRAWIAEQAAIAGAGDTALRGDSVAPQGTPFGIGLMAWPPSVTEQVEAVLALEGEQRPAFVSVSFGPLAEPVARLREAGLPVVSQVGDEADIEEALAADVDGLVARGGEGGGHGRDAMPTEEILRLALAATDRPVLAAGGIATSDDVAAVLAAGAAAAWCGTAFLTCREADNSEAARAALARATGTRYSRVHDVAQELAWPPQFGARAVATPFVREWAGREHEMDAAARAEHAAGRERGDVAYVPLYAGVGVERLTTGTDAATVVAELTPGGRG